MTFHKTLNNTDVTSTFKYEICSTFRFQYFAYRLFVFQTKQLTLCKNAVCLIGAFNLNPMRFVLPLITCKPRLRSCRIHSQYFFFFGFLFPPATLPLIRVCDDFNRLEVTLFLATHTVESQTQFKKKRTQKVNSH